MNQRAPFVGHFWIALSAVFLASGCQCKPANRTPALPDDQRNRDLSALPLGVGGLMEQLAAEAGARSKDPETIAIETVVTKSGVAFDAPQQVVGRTVLAVYCATARSNDGLTVTVCEFPSIEQAVRGAAELTAVRGKLSGWQARQRKKSTLEVVARSDATKESVDAVLRAFDAL